jgi:hypothetical protein
MQEWLKNCADLYLEHILQNETLPVNSSCSDCEATTSLFQCRDCLPQSVTCQQCLLRHHQRLPTHRARWWTGMHFANISLRALGVAFHLGHGGAPCNMGLDRDFLLCDTNGFHMITMRFCRHPGHGDPARQLLEAQIFPSSDKRPATGFTFPLLRQYALLESEGKLTMKRYYDVLVYLTNALLPHEVCDRYCELLRVSRQWIHLEDSKHSYAMGVSRENAQLMVRCPCCPRLSVNFEQRDIVDADWYVLLTIAFHH